MKKLLPILLFSISFCPSKAQSFREIDLNNVAAGFNAYGGMFYNDSNYTSYLHSNSVHPTNAIAGLWIGGYDGGGNLHLAASTYRQTGQDFWPGVLDTTSIVCDSARSDFYDNVWRMYCAEVDSFYNYVHGLGAAGYVVPTDIQSWPGNGDPAFGECHFLAPFTDMDADAIYNWTAGDSPLIKGQEALFNVYHDHLLNSTHTESGGLPLGIEIRAMPYEFNLGWDSAVSNTVFVHYTIINRNTVSYDSTIIGLWSDFDFGVFASTKTGCDSTQDMYFTCDSSQAIGVTFLNRPMKGFIAYNNDFSVMGNPTTADAYYQYMNQHWANDSALTYSGNGYGGNTSSNWMYSGDLVSGSGWFESLSSFDQRTIGSTAPFYLSPGGVIQFDVAFVIAHDESSPYACVTKLKQYVSDVRNFYNNESQDCVPGMTSIAESSDLSDPNLFPNPATDHINLIGMTDRKYIISNCLGQEMTSGTIPPSEWIDISELSSGTYFIRIGESAGMKFVKVE